MISTSLLLCSCLSLLLFSSSHSHSLTLSFSPFSAPSSMHLLSSGLRHPPMRSASGSSRAACASDSTPSTLIFRILTTRLTTCDKRLQAIRSAQLRSRKTNKMQRATSAGQGISRQVGKEREREMGRDWVADRIKTHIQRARNWMAKPARLGGGGVADGGPGSETFAAEECRRANSSTRLSIR